MYRLNQVTGPVLGYLLGLMVFSPAWANGAQCGEGDPCPTETGEYHLMFPEDWDGRTQLPAVIFFHGHRSSSTLR